VDIWGGGEGVRGKKAFEGIYLYTVVYNGEKKTKGGMGKWGGTDHV